MAFQHGDLIVLKYCLMSTKINNDIKEIMECKNEITWIVCWDSNIGQQIRSAYSNQRKLTMLTML